MSAPAGTVIFDCPTPPLIARAVRAAGQQRGDFARAAGDIQPGDLKCAQVEVGAPRPAVQFKVERDFRRQCDIPAQALPAAEPAERAAEPLRLPRLPGSGWTTFSCSPVAFELDLADVGQVGFDQVLRGR